ncbi:MAG: acyl-CoA dehydratase activase [bacterium]|nr:acyl-CoA dehydratase activase [bacterium]
MSTRAEEGMLYCGIDVGSVSAKVALVDAGGAVVRDWYVRHRGHPIRAVADLLRAALAGHPPGRIGAFAATGSGGKIIASVTGAAFVNEIIAQALAAARLCRGARTVIEMGGEDSKLIFIHEDASTGRGIIDDFSMNTVCAAGTGSFLDQQASRLGLSIEREFAEYALRSEKPPRIAGRCSVFAKSDMIHLQQIGTPDFDIVAGLCYAVARSFKSNVGRGKRFVPPVVFQGGVAANAGVVRAFRDVLGLAPDELVIPERHATTGAIGAALSALDGGIRNAAAFGGADAIDAHLAALRAAPGGMEPLAPRVIDPAEHVVVVPLPAGEGAPVEAYLGIDIGSLSTNVVVIDRAGGVLARRYLPTAGRPLEAVRRGLMEVGEELGGRVRIAGVGSTGSGRYLIGDYVGADVVRNEITAQATAAIHINPAVDTIFEIGGQDSKYVSISNGTVVDFEMNKVCAAGTGSFLEEQAEKLGIRIEEEFGRLALEADNPGRFGDRCTVFMESDLVAHQQRGLSKRNLVAGLAYSIVHNYLNRVVGDRRVGDTIFFQGGVAWNAGVVAAFERVTGKAITVPPHHDVTGAIGAALLAMRECGAGGGGRFQGFDLSGRKAESTSFTCNGCDNLCEIRKVRFDEERPHFYGARCEKYEVKAETAGREIPDYFAERERLLLGASPGETQKALDGVRRLPPAGSPRGSVGIPRVLHLYEFFPYWREFFRTLGYEVVLSETTNARIIHASVEKVATETCFPIKIVHGHVLSLLEERPDYLFLPSVINMARLFPDIPQSYCCPLVQAIPYILRASLDLDRAPVRLLQPPLLFLRGRSAIERALVRMGRGMGHRPAEVRRALRAAEGAQEAFYREIRGRGAAALGRLREGERGMVILGRPYNNYDAGINLNLPKKLRDLGVVPLPQDYLDLRGEEIHDRFPNMYWRYGQRILASARAVRSDPRLHAVYITNFKCGPDSFIDHFFRRQMEGKPFLHLEIDEHSADAGVITRCEAFLDSLGGAGRPPAAAEWRFRLVRSKTPRTLYVPQMALHAHAFAAAMRAFGRPAEALPESDARTVEIGRQFASGRECLPFITTTGDMLKKLFEPGFDHRRAAFFMPTAGGPCRFGQYAPMHRMILDDLGFRDVPVVSPGSSDSYSSEFGDVGPAFRRLAWRGLLAIDLLEKLAREHRPYETRRGETDRVFAESLRTVTAALEAGGDRIFGALARVRDLFRSVGTDRRRGRRPVIGVVGEIYVRSNRFTNNDVVAQIEALGGEAWVAPVTEWIFYTNNRMLEDRSSSGRCLEFLKGYLTDRIQRRDEERMLEAVDGALLNLHEAEIEEILALAAPYMHHSFGGEAILSIGKAIDYIRKGASGIVNVMPFTCMPGMVATAVSRSVVERFDGIPWLNVTYDGLEGVNESTRLEAFMHQARQARGAG